MSSFFSSIFNFIKNNLELIAAICGGIIALFQWKEANTNKRAEYLNNLLISLWENKDIQKFLLLNDYNSSWYDIKFHRGEDKTLPTLADKTLSFMNYICYLVNIKVIRKREIGLFDYYLAALALSNDMRCYLFDLYQYSILNNKPFLFNYFINCCIKNNLLPKGIKNKNFYKHIMLEESFKNEGKIYNLPEDILLTKNLIGQNLFLQTCSRCEHCTHFINNNCLKNLDFSNYFWLPETQNNPCQEFNFDLDSWNF